MRFHLLAGLCIAVLSVTPATAKTPAPAAPPPFTEGVHYQRLEVPVAPLQTAHIEVTEIFSYGCIHCFRFEPMVEAWRKVKPADVDLVLVPATFRADFALLARGYYASEAMGLAAAAHPMIWDALWKHQRSVKTLDEMADLYAGVGIDRGKFIDACASPGVDARLKRVDELLNAYKVEGTPDLLVAGKYRVLLARLTNASDAFRVVNYLLGLERAERKRNAGIARKP